MKIRWIVGVEVDSRRGRVEGEQEGRKEGRKEGRLGGRQRRFPSEFIRGYFDCILCVQDALATP